MGNELKKCLTRPCTIEQDIANCKERLHKMETSTESNKELLYKKHTMLTLNRLASLYIETNQLELARQAYTQLIRVTEDLAELIPDKRELFLSRLADAICNAAKITVYPDETEELYLKAIAIHKKRKEFFDSQNKKEFVLQALLRICTDLMSLYHKHEHDENVWELYCYVDALYETSGPESSSDWDTAKNKLDIQNTFYRFYRSIKNYEFSERLLRKKIETYEWLCEITGLYQASLAESYAELAELTEDESMQVKLYDKALKLYYQADMREEENDSFDIEILYEEERTDLNEKLARLHAEAGRKELSEKYTSEVLKEYEQTMRQKMKKFLKEMKSDL